MTSDFSNFSDKEILSDALNTEKATTANYNAFSNECVHESVRHTIFYTVWNRNMIFSRIYLKLCTHVDIIPLPQPTRRKSVTQYKHSLPRHLVPANNKTIKGGMCHASMRGIFLP